MSFDTRCLMTAEYFLGTHHKESEAESLAEAIQAAVESWFLSREITFLDRIEASQKETAQ